MTTIKSYTDLEQSKILAKILPIESADFHFSATFVFCWFGLCWCIMKIGRGIYWFGNKLSGDRLDPFNWTQEI